MDSVASQDSPHDSPHDSSVRADSSPTTDSIGETTALSCAEVDSFSPMYADLRARWAAQDALGPHPADPLVFVGSSSIRRWEGLALAWQGYAPIQRGFGGAQMGEVAQNVETLVAAYDPRGVVVYAGTNDVSAGVAPEVVIERARCFRARVAAHLGASTPVFFIGILPNPARWDQWEAASAVNAAIQADAEADAGLVYVDAPTAFLATGSPPASSLFVSDGLHLSAEGYALLQSALQPAITAVLPALSPAAAPTLASGTRILVDLGPSNAEDGELSPSPDYLGQHWNNWYAIEGDDEVVPGERLVDLVTSTGEATSVDLILTGGFFANGRSNGGLLWPDPKLLGDLAVGSATGDFFYTTGDDATGGFFLNGLSPAQTYTLRFFAARDETEVRVSAYTVVGATTAQVSLQTSGAGAGADGATTNNDDIATLTGVQPDAWGQLFVDVAIAQGSYAYLSALEIVVE